MLRKILNRRWYGFCRMCCEVFCRLCFRMRIYGKENIPEKGPFLLISNHQSFLDPLFCGAPTKKHLHFLARDTLFRNKFFGWLIHSVNTIPVRRGQADLTAMKKIIAILKDGDAVCLFPEGTRTTDGKIRPFKPGFGLIAKRASAPVVPVLIDGAFEAWPKHKKIFSPGHQITVTYCKAITPEHIQDTDDHKLAQTLTDTLGQLQSQLRREQGKVPYDYSQSNSKQSTPIEKN